MQILSLIAGMAIGAGAAIILARLRHGPRVVAHPGPPRSAAHPAKPLPRGSLNSEHTRDQVWAFIARMRDPLDQIATQMESDPEVRDSDSLTLMGLACRICVHESDHRRQEAGEFSGDAA